MMEVRFSMDQSVWLLDYNFLEASRIVNKSCLVASRDEHLTNRGREEVGGTYTPQWIL